VIHVFTSAALNYLGKVRALFTSVRRHHPELRCHFLVAERRTEAAERVLANEPFDEIAFATDLEPGQQPGWLFSHALVELATAIKPSYALGLLGRPDCEKVLYLDPDVIVFSRLDDILAALDTAAVALTPHLLRPEREPQAVLDNELSALRHGAFNLGFLGLANRPEARRFATWWRDPSARLLLRRPRGGSVHRPEVDRPRAGVLHRPRHLAQPALQRRSLEPGTAAPGGDV
jgi:hypothetical protein